jgi:hypothetical protein
VKSILKNVKGILVHDQSQHTTGAKLVALLVDNESQQNHVRESSEQLREMARNRGVESEDTPWFPG